MVIRARAETQQPYEYKQIDNASEQIRLVTILPGTFSVDLRVKITVFTFSKTVDQHESPSGPPLKEL